MQDKDLEDLFASADNISVNESAKKAAIGAAMQAYAKQNALNVETEEKNSEEITQGKFDSSRPTEKQTQSVWSLIMNTLFDSRNPKLMYGSLATTCALILGVTIVMNHPKEELEDYAFVDPEPLSVSKPEEVITTREVQKQDEKLPVVAEADEDSVQEVVVTDVRSRLEGAMKERRASNDLVDSISGEEYAAMPDANLAESLQSIAAAAPPAAVKQKKFERSVPAKLTTKVGQLPADRLQVSRQAEHRDNFEVFESESVKQVAKEPVSTFSIDVDTASYSFVRRQLNHGMLPSKNAVRIEEMINYFDYQYPLPKSKDIPFSTSVNVVDSPWNKHNKLVHIGIKGYEIEATQKPKTNLVFLLDVSGSMAASDKLPLVKQSMHMLLNQLNETDTVAIAVYAGAAGTVLEPTPVKEKHKIIDALNSLNAGGSTAGAEGIKLAYELAQRNFTQEGVNRIILATDGDFNVGITNRDELKSYVERKRQNGVFLSVLGFGQGNYNDHLMQTLAQNGNGIAAYIDTLSEAQKVLVDEATSSLFTIAKDVKIQVEFNPDRVSEYRLIGYETRKLKQEDFNNDAVDAGDIGSGHSVTAIYEITPKNAESKLIDESRYAKKVEDKKQTLSNEYGFLKLRYKLPKESKSKLISTPILVKQAAMSPTLEREVNFAVSVAGFAQLLRGNPFIGEWNYGQALDLAKANRGEDDFGYRTEFVQLIRKAQTASEM